MKGIYLIGCIETKDKKFLKSVKNIKNAVLSICTILGLKIVKENHHIFKNPYGVTYCFILSQSHFVLHTWPEESKIYFDIFTCNANFSKDDFISIVSSEFKGNVIEIKKIEYKR